MSLLFRRKEKIQQGVRKTHETWFRNLVELFQRDRLNDAVWEEAESLLIGADSGVQTTTTLLEHIRQGVERAHTATPGMTLMLLKEAMLAMLQIPGDPHLVPRNGISGKPLVLLVVGVNGAGKTTTVAKLAAMYKEEGKSVVLAAADTFRAAAIEQLQEWGERVGVRVVAHQQGGDPGAVAFDALQTGQARGADVVIVDTAGRLHNKSNLMEELQKVRRVLGRLDADAPHHTLLVLDATTGQNGLAQARAFTEAVQCSGIILAKLDGTAKGGIVLSISNELKLPVLFIGTGEGIEDLAPFAPKEFVDALLAPAQYETKPLDPG
jgi:fused signal recognition particle receptor